MENVIVKFKKTHPDAQLPFTKHGNPLTGDTGRDVYSVEAALVPARGSAVVDVGLEFAYITPGYWVKVEGRSGLGFVKGISPHNGIIDNPYRGNAGIKLYNLTDKDVVLEKGERIAQFVVYPLIAPHMEFTDEVDETERGANGFGSTGTK